MKKMKKSILIVLAAFIAVAFALPNLPANAAPDSSSALSIAPKKNYVIEPGKSVDDTLVIRNADSQSPLTLSMRVIDFSYTNDTGTPKLLLGPNEPQTAWSLKSYLNVPQTVEIAPGASKTVKLRVAMPKDVGPGSYYSAIIYSTGAPSSNTSSVGLSASGVTLVFVNVPGKVHEKLDLTKFGAYSAQNGYEYIAMQTPLNIAYSLKNSGNVVEAPVGSITLQDMFGHKTEIADVNPSKSLALIGQERTFLACIKQKTADATVAGSSVKSNECVTPGMWPGLYTATIDLYYGQNGNNTQEILKTAHFWYLPWWFIFISLAIIAVVSYYVWKIQRNIRAKLYGPRVSKLGSKGRRRR